LLASGCLAASALLVGLTAQDHAGDHRPTVVVGSKKFTESVILGELLVHLAREAGADARHRRELGGTQFLWKALISGEIDVYPEYTGTISKDILRSTAGSSPDELRQALAQYRIRMSDPLGFNNTYALGMREELAGRLGIQTISHLRRHPQLRLGFTEEFLRRPDCWSALQPRYQLPHGEVRTLDHDLAYRGLEGGSIQVIDLYSTDAKIALYKLRVLADDLSHFPRYEAMFLYRADLESRTPGVVASLRRLEGRISEQAMIALNARAELDRVPEVVVAGDFLRRSLQATVHTQAESDFRRFLRNSGEHLRLVGVSLAAAILLAVPLGVLAARRPPVGQIILATMGIVQTIPSLALLVLMIPVLGIGERPAVVALFLYSLLPIVRNTYAGLHDIPLPIRESADALGLPPFARLRLIELPMASRAILAGIKTSAVINVGTATLGAIIGAGGYGEPIMTGIRLGRVDLILWGALPAAVLAVVVQALFELAERGLVPRGLRLKPQT